MPTERCISASAGHFVDVGCGRAIADFMVADKITGIVIFVASSVGAVNGVRSRGEEPVALVS